MISFKQQMQMTELNKPIIALQKVAPTSLDTPEEQLVNKMFLQTREVKPSSTYKCIYCPTATVFLGVSDCLSFGNPILHAPHL